MGSGAVTVMGGVPTDTLAADADPSDLGELGHEYYYNGSFFKLVKNADGSALTAFRIVEWSDPAIGTASVTGTTTAGTGTTVYTAGVVQAALAASGGIGFVCSGGLTEGVFGGTTAAGDALYCDDTDGKFAKATVGTHHILGHSVDAGADGTASTVYLNRL